MASATSRAGDDYAAGEVCQRFWSFNTYAGILVSMGAGRRMRVICSRGQLNQQFVYWWVSVTRSNREAFGEEIKYLPSFSFFFTHWKSQFVSSVFSSCALSWNMKLVLLSFLFQPFGSRSRVSPDKATAVQKLGKAAGRLLRFTIKYRNFYV